MGLLDRIINAGRRLIRATAQIILAKVAPPEAPMPIAPPPRDAPTVLKALPPEVKPKKPIELDDPDDEIIYDDNEIIDDEEEDCWIQLEGTQQERLRQIICALADTQTRGKKLLLLMKKIGGELVGFPFSDKTKEYILNKLDQLHEVFYEEELVEPGNETFGGSDPEAIIHRNLPKYDCFKIVECTERKKYQKRERQIGFFPYVHLLKNSAVTAYLNDLQIYDEHYVVNNKEKIRYTRCVVESIKGQINPSKHEILRDAVKTDFYDRSKLTKLGELIGHPIHLTYWDDGDSPQTREYVYASKQKGTTVRICEIEKHFFRDEQTHFTKYYIKNHEEIDSKFPNTLPKLRARTTKILPNRLQIGQKNFLTSYQLVKLLLDHRDECLIDLNIESILSHPDQVKQVDIELNEKLDLEDENVCRLITKKAPTKPEFWAVLDFETYPDEQGQQQLYGGAIHLMFENLKHKTHGFKFNREIKDVKARNFYLIELIMENLMDAFVEEDIGTSVKKQALIFCHNLSYDIGFIIKHPRIHFMGKPIIANGRWVAGGLCYRTRNKREFHMLFKDSCRIIPSSLAKIPKMLGIPAEKEVMFHELFNYKTIDHVDKMFLSEIEDIIQTVKDRANDPDEIQKKYEEFKHKLDTVPKVKRKDGSYDLLTYALYYCEQDCRVTADALIKFDEIIQQIDDKMPSILGFYSLPSIAMQYFYVNNCFENCYEFNGHLAQYFGQFIVGGRCMLNSNKPTIETGKIDDFDACSLYPSAMNAFDGYLQGRPKIWNASIDLDTVDYYFVRVKITKIGRHLQFPVISKFDGETRDWTNNLVGQIIPLDKVGLEEAIKWQEIEYEIIDGYYFDEGFNTEIKSVITNVYQRRLKEKENKNEGLQQVLKLLMNSAYGKLIQKPVDSEITVVTGWDKLDRYLNLNYCHVKTFQSIGSDLDNKWTKYFVKSSKLIVNDFSSPQLGCQILSWSKRIMNSVMCLAENNGIKIFYQDTDSMHLFSDDVPKIEELFEAEYGRPLRGEDMGQFHTDFDVDGLNRDTTHSIKFIGLMKKTYLDICRDGSIRPYLPNEGLHIRAKGIRSNAIKWHAKVNNTTVDEIYQYLYDNPKAGIDFDLTADNLTCFDKTADFSYISRDSFVRRLSIAAT